MLSLADDFTDADLRQVLRRALRWVGIFLAVLAPVSWAVWGWRAVVLLAVGALVSATGIWEWQRLLTVLIAKMDNNQAARPVAPVMAMFFLRMGLAVLVVYGSLRCFAGPVYALVAGLALSLAALGVEGVRLLHR